VPVIAVGQDAFPAFWSRDSGLSAPLRLDTAEEIAAAHRMRAALGLPGGQLVANPIPAEAEIPAETLAPLIAEANAQAVAEGVSGKDVTPFLLQWLFERTEGRTLQANIALVMNNARLAARIARALANLRPWTGARRLCAGAAVPR
jgi:pseudouridine-5'-phosphate glycosidase